MPAKKEELLSEVLKHIVDNQKSYHATIVKECLNRHKNAMELFFSCHLTALNIIMMNI